MVSARSIAPVRACTAGCSCDCPPAGWRECGANAERQKQERWTAWCFILATGTVGFAVVARALGLPL